MYQLYGTLTTATVRLNQRTSWMITAQHLSASSLASKRKSKPDLNLEKIKEDSNTIVSNEEAKTIRTTEINKKSITSLIKNFSQERSPKEHYLEFKKLNQSIYSAQTIDELLDTTKNPNFNSKNAAIIARVLHSWNLIGKLSIGDIANDERYLKICSMIDVQEKISQQLVTNKLLMDQDITSTSETEITIQQIKKFNNNDIITVLSSLANKCKRQIPIIQTLVSTIITSKTKINLKQISDILYSLSKLNFFDEELMKKLSESMLKVEPPNESTAIIGSILISIGLLRYRDELLINLLTEWIIQRKSTVRPRDVCSLLMTLACLGYKPPNFDKLFEEIIEPLHESEMCKSSDWLNIVWSLTILNKSTSEHYESVLNNGFISRLFDQEEQFYSKAIKLLNVNAAARLLLPDYKGPVIGNDSKLLNTRINKTKDSVKISNSVISALKILLPSDSAYINVEINTKMGFLLDAEFCVDSKCTPLPCQIKPNNNQKVFRIAVFTCSYHQYCRKTNNIIGPIQLYKTLLEKEGYDVLLTSYSEIDLTDKLVNRVKYINDKVKLLVQNKSAV